MAKAVRMLTENQWIEYEELEARIERAEQSGKRELATKLIDRRNALAVYLLPRALKRLSFAEEVKQANFEAWQEEMKNANRYKRALSRIRKAIGGMQELLNSVLQMTNGIEE